MWKLSQDVIWEKQNGTGFTTDRFRRVHDHCLHWYRGPWADVYHATPRLPTTYRDRGNKRPERRENDRFDHTGAIGEAIYTDDRLDLHVQ